VPPRDDYLEANRALWDEWTAIHQGSDFYDLESFKKGGVRLHDFEVEEIGDVRGKDLLHLQCHFGIDTLSWARLGARVTGVDFSGQAVELARRLADDLALEATFVHANVLELPDVLDGKFDVVYTSRGVLGWLPDVPRWAEVIARFLRPGGFFYIHEIHPFVYVFDIEEDATVPRVKYPYFARTKPLAFESSDYAVPDAPVKQPFAYDWSHSMGEIINSLVARGLHIEFLHEWPFLNWEMPFLEKRNDGLWWYPGPGELPLSFSLKATKEGTA
jgi:SAM-dependent methyltransferase